MRLRLLFPALGAMLLAFSCQANAAPASTEEYKEEYKEGVHYVALKIPTKAPAADKIEVAEYFSYGCPHCYQLEPYIAAWHNTLPDDVTFIRTPAIWNPTYKIYAQAYYTASALNVLDKMHRALFMAIQQGRALKTSQAMAQFFQAQGGVPIADFYETYRSFAVNTNMRQADAKGRSYRASGVPAIIVNGKYRIEGSMAGSNANMLKIADYLLEKERQHQQMP